EQERISFLAGATYSHYQNLHVQSKAWGIPPLELNASLKWKLLKDLQVSSELYVMSGNPFQDKSGNTHTSSPIADLNAGVEFTVVPKLNLWLQMKNVLNTEYQRWNQYTVLGFNVLGGVVYSFR
ncbi:MAG TPA: TonB-dependent receptor, partial [Sediminibacterium sp.]|nr:TonB-dependent receptor [Sediminibacterium sp.]